MSFPSGLVTPGGLRNLVINGGFQVNQRGYASGATLAAGAYGHDRWKAGSGGCSYGFTSTKPDTTITITAGSLVQIVEDVNVVGGAYTLSWTGTAQARIGAGAFAASPLTVTGLAAGAPITIEFGTGTLGKVQLEPGLVGSPLEKRSLTSEIQFCQRYFSLLPVSARFVATAVGNAVANTIVFPVTMRVTPNSSLNTPGIRSNISGTAPNVFAGTPAGGYFSLVSSAAGDCYALNDLWNISAEL